MNDKQPEALELASHIEFLLEDYDEYIDSIAVAAKEASEELRRLHEAHEWQYKVAGDRMRRIVKLKRVNAKLLDALVHIKATGVFVGAIPQAMMDEAIEKAEERA